MIFCITNTTLLQMERRQEYKPGWGDVVMERRPNSGPDNPATSFTEHLEHACTTVIELRPTSGPATYAGALLVHQTPDSIRTPCPEWERADLYRMKVYWEDPRYPGFCSYTARQMSFQHKDWPHKKLNIQALSAAGFFYTGNVLCILLLLHKQT